MVKCEHRDKFCSLCAWFAPVGHNRKVTKNMKEAYEKYFKSTLENEWYVPEIMCTTCQTSILKRPTKMKYVFPTKWLPRLEHISDSCYFCINMKRAKGFGYANRKEIDYATVDSVVPPVLRSDENPLAPGERDSAEEQMDFGIGAGPSAVPSVAPSKSPSFAVGASSTDQPDSQKSQTLEKPNYKLFSRRSFDNLARELELSDEQREIMESRFRSHRALNF